MQFPDIKTTCQNNEAKYHQLRWKFETKQTKFIQRYQV